MDYFEIYLDEIRRGIELLRDARSESMFDRERDPLFQYLADKSR